MIPTQIFIQIFFYFNIIKTCIIRRFLRAIADVITHLAVRPRAKLRRLFKRVDVGMCGLCSVV